MTDWLTFRIVRFLLNFCTSRSNSTKNEKKMMKVTVKQWMCASKTVSVTWDFLYVNLIFIQILHFLSSTSGRDDRRNSKNWRRILCIHGNGQRSKDVRHRNIDIHPYATSNIKIYPTKYTWTHLAPFPNRITQFTHFHLLSFFLSLFCSLVFFFSFLSLLFIFIKFS